MSGVECDVKWFQRRSAIREPVRQRQDELVMQLGFVNIMSLMHIEPIAEACASAAASLYHLCYTLYRTRAEVSNMRLENLRLEACRARGISGRSRHADVCSGL